MDKSTQGTKTPSPSKITTSTSPASDQEHAGEAVGFIPTLSRRPLLGVQNVFVEYLREMILHDKIEEPLVFRKIHQDWGPCKWTLGDWGDIFRDEKLSVRYGRQSWDQEHPQWESLCESLEITWTRLIEWVRGEYSLPIAKSSPEDIWMYYDYKYLPEVIHLKSESEKDFLKLIYLSENLKKTFSWNALGFPDRNGDHSTLWIGTAGSYTNTHYDTYSCNLICQVYGRKTWLVFPPCDTNNLKPTRIPYEESSVYSQINLASAKQMQKNKSALQQCSPRKITLEPGDCLYLPPKWWHFVKSEDFSISVNTWIELPCDHFTRVEEAVLRAIVSSVVNSSIPSTADRILNPNEMDLTEIGDKESEETLHLAAKTYLERKSTSSTGESDAESPVKKPKLDPKDLSFDQLVIHAPVQVEKLQLCKLELDQEEQSQSQPSTSSDNDNVDKGVAGPSGSNDNDSSNSPSSPPQFDDDDNQNHRKNPSQRSPTFVEHVLNAVGHPTVLKQVALQFLNNVQRSSSE